LGVVGMSGTAPTLPRYHALRQRTLSGRRTCASPAATITS